MAETPRPEQWKKVDEAVNKGLPKSAAEILTSIYDGAIKDKAYPEATRALAQKIAVEGQIQGRKPEEKIFRLEAEIGKAPAEMKPVLEAILAHWYWQYFQVNSYRFVQRSATAEPPGKDIQTWDLTRILAEIDKHFFAALAYEKELKAIPVASFKEILTDATMSDSYRPTLYDFVAFETLNFLNAGEQAGSKAEDSFELLASSPIFSSVEDFINWTPKSTDEQSRFIKAIKLYQNLLKFHADAKTGSAYLDADLHRLQFAYNAAIGEEKKSRYLAALKAFIKENEKHELVAQAYFLWASVIHVDGDFVEAKRLATLGEKAFPNSKGGLQCHNLIQQIMAKSAQVLTERVWNEPEPEFTITYANVNKVYFRMVKVNWEQRLTRDRYRAENLNQADRETLVSQKPDLEWSIDLPETTDYKPHTETVHLPKQPSAGFYFLLSSHDPKFQGNDNFVQFTDVWVSRLAVIQRQEQGSGTLGGFVLDAVSGDPIANATIRSWYRDNNAGIIEQAPVMSDANGQYTIPKMNQRQILILAKHQDQQLASVNEVYTYQNDFRVRPYDQVVFFTDRSIYRPGQTISFKGIAVHNDPEKDSYTTIANRKITVTFQDVNGKEIEKRVFSTNNFGSFAGSFTAPRDRLMGQMTIVSSIPGTTNVRVEEYKRPKFKVTLDKPKEAAKLDQPVTLTGKALSYTGAAIDGAKVKYRVVRNVRYPAWWGWYFWYRQPVSNASQEIAHGTLKTDVDGTFKITFPATPDRTISEKDEPTFTYTVYADVTDTTGETRSDDQSVAVGYTALSVNLSANDWQTTAKAVEVTVRATTLDGEAQAATGKIKVYALKSPEKVERPLLTGVRGVNRGRRGGIIVNPKPAPDRTNPNTWELGEVLFEKEIKVPETGSEKVEVKLPVGSFRVIAEFKDKFGKDVKAQLPLQVIDPDAKSLAIKIPNWVGAKQWNSEVGQEFVAIWGTGYDRGRAFIEVEHRGKLLQSYWTDAAITQTQIKQKINEGMRGGFTLRVTQVRENRAFLSNHLVDVPWSNKDLTVSFEKFTSKLEPGKKETWTVKIRGKDAEKAVTEMVATLYDASLNVFQQHFFSGLSQFFRRDSSRVAQYFENQPKYAQYLLGQWTQDYRPISISYRTFRPEMIGHVNGQNTWYFAEGGFGFGGGFGGRGSMRSMVPMSAAAPSGLRAEENMLADGRSDRAELGGKMALGKAKDAAVDFGAPQEPGGSKSPDLGKVSPRKNLNETAFFFPQLVSNSSGEVTMTFTMPEALTEWSFLGFAHDSQLRGGSLTEKAVTSKDLMVQPNPPRFLREGDLIEFTVKVSNQSAGNQKGSVRLSLSDARTLKNVDADFGNAGLNREFDIPSKESKTFSWKLKVPDGAYPVIYQAVGSTGNLSDGEEGMLAVLAKRILVTESLPLPIRDIGTKKFDFTKLRLSKNSETLKNESVTVQMVSNPSWYAVMALPYLMEYPHECSEQTFNRLYANSLARHIAKSDPKIRRIFDQWKNTPALDSPLEKNQDLKSVMIEETPWLRQANNESASRRNVGILFDENRLDSEMGRALEKLVQMQRADGLFPWFPGGPANEYLTLYITTGFGRMRHLGVKLDMNLPIKTLVGLDQWIDRIYREILKAGHPERNHLSPTICMYLYGRSFFLKDKPIDDSCKEAVKYFLGQAKKFWLTQSRQSQGHLAIGLKRFSDLETAKGIMASILEHSVTNEEMGMFWRDTELSFWWYRAPIETQALMIEAFDEVSNDMKSVEECKVWLLKQKQTQDWKTTKATADAVYALMLRGDQLIKSDALVEVKLAGETIKPENVEAGTGFYETKFRRGEIKPEMADISVTKTDKGVAWGSIHWQYLEDVNKVTPHEGTPLKLTKSLFIKQATKKGPVLEALKGPAQVGDELVVRVELRTDRDMEYVHLKDHRGSGTEPVNVLSQYKYQDGLAYYESTKDTASHFFIDYLPKGVYVFEYSVRVQLKGQYTMGLSSIECMYAPEFNSHSGATMLEVK
jgi:uncharacterized protein YfaS (alpha-2-macroglobulin family)